MKIQKILFLAIIMIFAISCDKEETLVTLDDFVGSWKATSFVFTSNSNPDDVLDVIASGGELRFTMLEQGKVRIWLTFGTFSDEWDSQAEITDDNTIILTPAEAERGITTLDFVFGDSDLKLTNHNDSFDFTLSDETGVPATSVAVFVRN